MALIEITLYSNADGSPLSGNASSMSFASFKRFNADGTVTDLAGSAPSWTEPAAAMYRAEVPDALLIPGSEIRYIFDTGTSGSPPAPNATVRFYDGVVNSIGPRTFGAVQANPAQPEAILRKGDRSPSLVFQLVDGEGDPVDLSSGSPSVVLNMRSDQGGNLTISGAACSIVDATSGLVLFPWPDSSSWAGNYFWEMVLTQGGLQSTFPYAKQGIARVLPHV